VFHDGLSPPFVQRYTTREIEFVRIPKLCRNPVDSKWLAVACHLAEHAYDRVFVTDISDVEVRSDPFRSHELWNDHVLFCGDEPEVVGCPWMRDLAERLGREKWVDWIHQNSSNILLNAGVLGGRARWVRLVASRVAVALQRWVRPDIMADMLLVNMVARSLRTQRLFHGHPVTTRFKAFEDRRDVWFAHK